jgi:SAM-dependent methyltransferase
VRQSPLLEEDERDGRIKVAQSERSGVYLGKALSCGFDARVELDEYRRMAAVEDEMWFYRALHAHIERELVNGLREKPGSNQSHISGRESLSVDLPGRASEPSFDVLDAGCGTGGLIRRLAHRHPNWRWTGVDLEPLACELSRQRCAANIVQGSVGALPFSDESFDAAVCSDVLYHLDDDLATVREIFRVLRPGGVVVINVPAHRWLWSYHDVTVHGRRRYDRGELRRKLVEAGFKPAVLTHWNALPLPLVILRRKLLPPPASGSDVRLYPRPIEAMFRSGAAVERWWIRSFGPLAFGSSILARARKP